MININDRLVCWANGYETAKFISSDPIQFPRSFCIDTDYAGRIMDDRRNVEISGFIAAWLSYGRRDNIIEVVGKLHTLMEYKPYEYLMSQEWRELKDNRARLYRFNTYGDYYKLLSRLYGIYTVWDTLEDAVLDSKLMLPDRTPYIYPLQMLFNGVFGIPETDTNSACKRLAMFLRWMVRRNSPVDMGIWTRCQPDQLIIPLDTHVHKMALNLGITKRKSADMKTAKEITDYFTDIFPGDPARGDFALFGYGIENMI